MLVEEQSSREQDHIFLYQAHCGVGYQLAGALQRLGRKMSAWVESSAQLAALKAVPMPTLNAAQDTQESLEAQLALHNHFVFSCFPSPSCNEAMTTQSYTQLQDFLLRYRKILQGKHLIFVMARNENLARLQQFKAFPAQVSLLLTSAAYGPGDHNLFDSFFAAFMEKRRYPRVEEKLKEFIFVGDVVSAVVSLLGKWDYYAKVMALENAGETLQDWCTAFKQHFPEGRSWLTKTFRRPEEFAFQVTDSQHGEKLEQQFQPESSIQLFPVNPSVASRALQVCAQALRAYPDMKLIYPPSRSP